MANQSPDILEAARQHGLGPALEVGAIGLEEIVVRKRGRAASGGPLGALALPENLAEADMLLQDRVFDVAILTSRERLDDPGATGCTHFAFRPDEYDKYAPLLTAKGFEIPVSASQLTDEVSTHSSEAHPNTQLEVVKVSSALVSPPPFLPPENAITVPTHSTTVLLGFSAHN